MEKTIEFGGAFYTAHRLRNVDNNNITYFKRMLSLMYGVLADTLNLDREQVASTLLDFAYISGLVTGGTALLTRVDSGEVFQKKCTEWLINADLVPLSTALTELVNDVNPKEPDRALAPEPLPPDTDFLASNAAKPNRKRRAPTG